MVTENIENSFYLFLYNVCLVRTSCNKFLTIKEGLLILIRYARIGLYRIISIVSSTTETNFQKVNNIVWKPTFDIQEQDAFFLHCSKDAIAKRICNHITKLGFTNMGVKTRTDLYFINYTKLRQY